MLRAVIALIVFAFCAAAAAKEQSGRDSRLIETAEILFGLFLAWVVMVWAS